MTITSDASNKTVSIAFTPNEWNILIWGRTTFGAGVFQDLIHNWLKHMWRQGEDARLKALENPPPAELQK